MVVSTCAALLWRARSATQGTPNGRFSCFPGFGIYTRRMPSTPEPRARNAEHSNYTREADVVMSSVQISDILTTSNKWLSFRNAASGSTLVSIRNRLRDGDPFSSLSHGFRRERAQGPFPGVRPLPKARSLPRQTSQGTKRPLDRRSPMAHPVQKQILPAYLVLSLSACSSQPERVLRLPG